MAAKKSVVTRMFLAVMIALTVLAPSVVCSAPYLISLNYNVDNHNTPSYIVNHMSSIESRPFDGIAIKIPTLTYYLFYPDYARYMGWTATGTWSYDQCMNYLSPLTATSFSKFKHNFAIVAMNPYGGSPGQYEGTPELFDDADWTCVINSFQNLCRALKDKGIQGILLDDEGYTRPDYWAYDSQQARFAGKTLQECVDKAKYRGKQIMQAARSVYPDIVIIPLWGPTLGCTAGNTGNVVPGTTSDVRLSGGFYAGLVDAADDSTGSDKWCLTVDGGERYPLTTAQEFKDYYMFSKYTMASPEVQCLFMDNNLRNIWTRENSVAYGVYDHTLVDDVLVVRTDMDEFQNVLTNALKTCDRYVWLYSETIDWLGAPGDIVSPRQAPTQAWVDAVVGARAASGYNQVANPGFESGLNGWTLWGVGDAGATVVASPVHSGSGALKSWVYSGTVSAGGYQCMPVVPNSTYRLSFYANQTVDNGTSYVGTYCLDSNYQQLTGCHVRQTMSGTGYKSYTYDIETPANTAYIEVYVLKTPSATGELYVDDFSLLQVAQNELKNPGFESGTSLTGWTEWGAGADAVSTPASAIHSGSWAMLAPSAATQSGGYQIVPAAPNTIYTLSFYAKETVAGSVSSVGTYCLGSDGTKISGNAYKISQPITGTEYTKYTYSFKTPPGTASVEVYVSNAAGGTGDLCVDDFKLTSDPMVRNTVQNSSFEGGDEDWVITASGTNAVVLDATLAHKGAWLVSISNNGANPGAYQDVIVEPSATYDLSCWMKQSGTGTSYLEAYCLNSSGSVIAGTSTSQSFTGTSYARVTLPTITTTGDTAKIRVSLRKEGTTGCLYADDAYLVAAQAGRNQSKNPGFESGLSEWTTWGLGTTTTVSNPVHSGASALSATSTADPAKFAGVHQYLPAVPNALYLMRWWGKQTVTDPALMSMVGLYCRNDAGQDLAHNWLYLEGTAYDDYVCSIVTPPGTTKIEVFVKERAIGSGGTMYVDDISLVKFMDW